MGCSSDKSMRCEEASIIYAEAALNFTLIKLPSFLRSIRRLSVQGSISPSDFSALSEKFDFKTQNFGVHQHIEKFFDSFKDDHGNYKQNALIILSIILSGSKTETKSKVLFDSFVSESAELSRDMIKEILTEMFRVSAYNLVLLVNSKHVDEELEHMIEKYCEKIMKVVELAVNKISTKHFNTDQITFTAFCSFFEHKPVLITATGLRYHLYLLNHKEKSKNYHLNLSKSNLNK